MPDYQFIDYRLRRHTKRTDLPADVLRDIGDAYAEINGLREERDEARREVMLWMSERSSTSEMTAEYKKRGWGYLKESSDE
ncbi:MAG: hypothetical protein RL316_1124 [Bacteroidota bacterium]|jgi:hypothetical protein